jgi:hypothetical protein
MADQEVMEFRTIKLQNTNNFVSSFLRSALFWNITQRRVVITIRRCVISPMTAYLINLLKPSGNLNTNSFNIQKFCVVLTLLLWVLYGSQNKKRLLSYGALRDWFLYRRKVFTVRCGLGPYISNRYASTLKG